MGYYEKLEIRRRAADSSKLNLIIEDYSNVELRLELSNICNHKCIFCPNHFHGRKPSSMDKELAFRLIDESSQLGVKKMGLFMNGEPFITENLHEYIAFAKTKELSMCI